MKAIACVPGTKNVRLVDRPEPGLTAPDEVKLQVVRVGICGTDREEAGGGRAKAPDGAGELVLGHEMLGRVQEAGAAVTRVKTGDFAACTVRRGCGGCIPCRMNRPDMCRTGHYRERGIWGLDGYQTEYVVEREQNIVRVPPELEPEGVLCEPLSVAEKAIDEAVRIQSARLPDAPATPDWIYGRRCLVAGLGPIGLLAALALRLRGAEVIGLDIVDADSPRPRWLQKIGGRYADGRAVSADKVDDVFGGMDVIFESAGVAALEFNLLDALALDGIYVLTGIPGGDRRLVVPGAELIRGLVLGNLAMVGSVNAARDHFQMAVADLEQAARKWGNLAADLITHRHPYTDCLPALQAHPPDEIKAVVEWRGAAPGGGKP
jgi:threonine dehydrogenase-like Zn-dependent dehydrogenase